MSENAPPKATWRFPSTFWFANSMELCERAAYYGFFILITVYLSTVVGFSDIEAGSSQAFSQAHFTCFPPSWASFPIESASEKP